MRLHWIKSSYCRYSAKVGRLRVSVRRCGIAKRGMRIFWVVDEVFGARHNDNESTDYPDAQGAMERAEELADQLLRHAIVDFYGHHPGTGTVSNGS